MPLLMVARLLCVLLGLLCQEHPCLHLRSAFLSHTQQFLLKAESFVFCVCCKCCLSLSGKSSVNHVLR